MQNTKCKNTAVKSNSSLNTTIKGIKNKIVFNTKGGIIMPNNSTPLSTVGGVVVSSTLVSTTRAQRTPNNSYVNGYLKALYNKGALNTLDFLGKTATLTNLNTLYNNISLIAYCGLITPYTTHNTTVGGVVVKGANNHTATINTNAIQKALTNGIPAVVNGVTLTPRHLKGGGKFLNAIKTIGGV